MDPINTISKPVILFDGVCNLCNSSVQFVIERDKKNTFQFASLQSDFARSTLPQRLVEEEDLKSIVLYTKEKTLTKSSAVLTVAKSLSGLWPVLYGFMIIPRFIRDGVYDIIAANRYKWFGKKDECMIPTPDMKIKFID